MKPDPKTPEEKPKFISETLDELMLKLGVAEKAFQGLGTTTLPGGLDAMRHTYLLRELREMIRQGDFIQRKAAENLLETESRFRSVWENSADGMRLTDASGNTVAVNDAFCRMVNMKREDIEGHPFTITYSEKEDLARIMQKYQQRFRTRNIKPLIERKLTFRSGKSVSLEVANSFIESAGQKPLLLGIFRDKTRTKRLEEQLQQVQKMDSIGRLAAGIAQDFTNLLTVIQGHASLLQSTGSLPPDMLESIREISTAADTATQLNRQLFIFSRRQIIQPRELDLNDLVHNIGRMLPRILGANIRLQIACANDLTLINADAGLLEQVIMNLAVFAHDSMPQGGTLSISTYETTIDDAYVQMNLEATPGKHICLAVSDTGRGIAPEFLPFIFEPFFNPKDAGRGTGLALGTVYGIVKQHKGWIITTSELGKGSAFHIYLPSTGRRAKPGETTIIEERPTSGAATAATILTVDDEDILLEMVKYFLQSDGYNVLEAPSGVAALKVWEQNKHKIDLLLTDIVMPGGVNGRQLAERLVADKPALKVIYTSGYSADILGKNFILQEGINFLQKPYHRRQLLQLVRKTLES